MNAEKSDCPLCQKIVSIGTCARCEYHGAGPYHFCPKAPREDYCDEHKTIFDAKLKESTSCVCDFCSSEKVRWAYPAEDFLVGAIAAVDPETGQPFEVQPMGSKGPWAACDPCAELIERGDYEALRQRGFDAIPAHQVVDPNLARTMLVSMHNGFREHRTGPRTEVA